MLAPIRPRRAWMLLAVTSAIGVLVACLVPSEALETGTVTRFDKAGHAIAFAWVGACFALARLSKWPLILIGTGLAVGTELAQYLFTADRSAEFGDLVADLVGFALGAVLARNWLRRAAQAES